MESVNLHLQVIIDKIIEEIDDSSVHYLVYTSYHAYYNHCIHTGMLHFNKNFIHDISLTDNGLICGLVPDHLNAGGDFTFRIQYDWISKICRFYGPDDDQGQILFLK